MSAHRYWRVRATGVQSGTYFSLRELIFRDAPGGAQKAVGGAVIASSEYGFAPKASAFDGDTGTTWGASGAIPQWIGYDFGAGVNIELAQIVIYAEQADSAPTAFTIDCSDDGGNWTTAYTASGSDVSPWTANQIRTINTGLIGSGTPTARPAVFVCL